jgi:hypothetical protein
MVDVLILAESTVDPVELIGQLSSNGRAYRSMRVPHQRIQIYHGYAIETFVDWVRDEDRLCLRRFQAPGEPEIILGAVHLASGLQLERAERKAEAAHSLGRFGKLSAIKNMPEQSLSVTLT